MAFNQTFKKRRQPPEERPTLIHTQAPSWTRSTGEPGQYWPRTFIADLFTVEILRDCALLSHVLGLDAVLDIKNFCITKTIS